MLAIGVAVPAHRAHAQSGLIGTPIRLCVAPARPSLSARTLLTSGQGFDCGREQIAFGPGDFDVRSERLRTRPDQTRVRIASVWQDSATLDILYADGAIRRLTDRERQTSRYLQLGAIVERDIPQRGAPAVRLLWRVRGAANMRGIVLGATIASAAQSGQSNLTLAALYAAFAGLCVALLVYNLALWAALRHRFQLAYCTMVATLLVYAVSSSGALAWIVPAIGNNDRVRINYLALAVAAIAALSFARSFFEARVFEGWLNRLSRTIAGILGSSALAFAILAPWHARWLDRVYAASFMLLMLAVVPILWRAWRRRSNYLWLFTLGWAAPIMLATLRVASNFAIVRWSFLLDNSTIAAMTMEAILSSLAIAYRIKLLSRERDEAREQGVAARLLAATDPLTGLLNRRAFLEQAIGRTVPHRLLLVDIDHFKRVNETLGHDGGDEVLRVVARALRASVPGDALIARIGGEEFAILAPRASSLCATAVLDRLREERMPFDLIVTASIGTCTGPLLNEVDWKMLYRSADRALFAAKAAGRDRARDADAPAAAA